MPVICWGHRVFLLQLSTWTEVKSTVATTTADALNCEGLSTLWRTQSVKQILFFALAALSIISGSGTGSAWADSITPDDLAFFENKIRPVLVEHCYECHSADSEELGGKLRLDHREGVRTGGESGPALVAGDPQASLLVHALRYDGVEMPPNAPLPEAIVNDFVKWIDRGAPDPRAKPGMVKPAQTNEHETDKPKLWSIQPVRRETPPDVKQTSWPRSPIDRFVLAKMESQALKPTEDADARTLARRLYYDLIGLPPTLAQLEAFSAAHQRNPATAVANLVDELLASREFGVRWGRYWLDVVRYGESNGNDGLGRNPTFPHAWRYRDYVIDAFNADTPYDRFLTEQIAGDLLPSDSPQETDRNLVATGMLAMASKPAKAMNTSFEMDVVADQIDIVGRGIIGLSIRCARCHDHKFDPIPTRDYYALAGIFTSSNTMWGVAANEGLTAPVTDLHVLKAAPKVLPPKDFVETVLVLESNTGKPKPIPKSKWAPGTPLAMGVRDGKPADCKINIKGDAKKLGEAVPRGFLTAFELEQAFEVDQKQSGRLQLAEWLTDRSHPLTARVMVNRIWLHLFGAGIVRTPDDFGVYGERPTHPELLDYLASQFMDDGWSIKRLIRSIVLSRSYQLSSCDEVESIAADPTNLWLTRHQRRRLDAESLRDSMLAVSGQLNLQPSDGSIIRHRDILVNLAGSLHEPSQHRSVYLCYLRSSPPPELAAFDLPDFTGVLGQRVISTVPGQALHLYNNPFVLEQSQHFARLVMDYTASDLGRVQFAWNQALMREPSADELQEALDLIESLKASVNAEEIAWASLCQALLITNEFRYVD